MDEIKEIINETEVQIDTPSDMHSDDQAEVQAEVVTEVQDSVQTDDRAEVRNEANSSSTADAYAMYNSGYGSIPGGPRYNTGYNFVSTIPEEPVRKKRHMPHFLKVILAAALFGLVASGIFILSNELYYKVNPSASTSTHHHGSEKTGLITPGKGAGESEASTVSSTSLISNVDTKATDVSGVVESAMPSIVSINCTFVNTSFFGSYESSGAGSGIILKKTDDELLIATNNHVVEKASSINVTFSDGSVAPAIIKGTDAAADLAVISISLEDLTAETLSSIKVATLGDSDNIKVGQMVVAIGNAMGYGQSTTVGYISAKDREVTVDNTTMTLLQTDAAINPGNSGGALLNLNGEVIGINSVKYADESVEGMGFAIPISRALAILDELASRETLKDSEKGYLGVYIKDVDAEMAAYYNIPVGAYIAQFAETSPAPAAGLQVGDIITGINGVTISTSDELKSAVTSYRFGTEVKVTYYRLIDGVYTEKTAMVTLIANPN